MLVISTYQHDSKLCSVCGIGFSSQLKLSQHKKNHDKRKINCVGLNFKKLFLVYQTALVELIWKTSAPTEY